MSTVGDPTNLRPLRDLPDAVRQRLVEWASQALDAATPTEIPSTLTRFARFAPAKRAKLAAAALIAALQSDPAFRSFVAGRAAQPTPDATGAIDAAGQDPIGAAARAVLLRLPEQDDLLAAAVTVSQRSDDRARVRQLEKQLRALTGRLERSEADLRTATARAAEPGSSDQESELKRRLREQGSRIRELQQRIDTERATAEAELARVSAERDRAAAEIDVWRERMAAAEARADAASQNVQRLRESAGDRRAASDRRLELLLGALEGAASGLRREWDLVGGGPLPGDVVAAGLPQRSGDAARTSDPSRLAAWAAMPGVHVIVDGYNVTKTGYPELSLSEQRDRLVRTLAAFAARTSAEMTVVFDGAAVAAARPAGRGIRVLFSPPGVIADEVIRDLVRAEPVGRALIVVSSDREVVDRAAADGARTAASAALLAVLGG